MQAFKNCPASKGFTLVELIVVIVILGIVSVGVSSILKSGTQAYLDVSQREQLLRDGSFVIERLNREIASAVPNSVRVSGNATAHCLELVPIKWSTFYLNLPVPPSSATQVDIVKMVDEAGNLFVPTSASDIGIVYPTRSADIYNDSNNRRHTLTSCVDDGDGNCATDDDSDGVLQLTFDGTFAQPSPAKRLYLADSSVSYCVRNNAVYRHQAQIASTQTIYTGGGVLMAQKVANVLASSPLLNTAGTQNPFRVVDSSLRRNAYVQIQLMFARDDELMPFSQEVHIPNVP